MNRKMLVVSVIVLLALSIGFAGGRVGSTDGSGASAIASLASSPDAQSQDQTKRQGDISVTSVTSVAPQSPLAPVGTGFTYQGRLSQANVPANGVYDFRFTLYDALTGGNQVGDPSVVTLYNQTVTGGLFTVQVDFGSNAFLDEARWIELWVARPGDGWSALAPRQPITPSPYSQSAAWTGTSGKPFPYNPLRGANVGSLLDGPGNVGQYSSITVGADGLGLISYSSNLGLKAAHCSNPACSTATVTTVDDAGDYTSITIGTDGLGLISYYDWVNQDLKVAHCSNAACTAATKTTLDSANDVGQHTSITIGQDGMGHITYYDVTNRDLKLARCNNTACTTATITTLYSPGDVGQYSSITLGADGVPLISFWDAANGSLKATHCSNIPCTITTTNNLDFNGSYIAGQYSSIAIGSDGLGLVSYYDVTNQDLKVAHCADTACSSAALVTLHATGDVGKYTSITIGTDGLGLISYYDATLSYLKVAHCSNVACTSAIPITVDGSGALNNNTAITIGADGLPLISYRSAPNFSLKVLKCGSVFCVSNFHKR